MLAWPYQWRVNFLRNLVLHLNCWIKSESYFRPQMRCLQNLSNVNSRLSPIVHPYNVPNVAELKRTFKSRVDELKVFLQVRSRLNQENGPVARGYKPQRPTRHSLSYQGNIFSSSWFNHFLVFIIRVSVFFFLGLSSFVCVTHLTAARYACVGTLKCLTCNLTVRGQPSMSNIHELENRIARGDSMGNTVIFWSIILFNSSVITSSWLVEVFRSRTMHSSSALVWWEVIKRVSKWVKWSEVSEWSEWVSERSKCVCVCGC